MVLATKIRSHLLGCCQDFKYDLLRRRETCVAENESMGLCPFESEALKGWLMHDDVSLLE